MAATAGLFTILPGAGRIWRPTGRLIKFHEVELPYEYEPRFATWESSELAPTYQPGVGLRLLTGRIKWVRVLSPPRPVFGPICATRSYHYMLSTEYPTT